MPVRLRFKYPAICVFASLFIISFPVFSQFYDISQAKSAFSIESSSSVEVIAIEASYEELPIDIDFKSFGNANTQFCLADNGFIQLGDTFHGGSYEGQFLFEESTENSVIATTWTENDPGNCCFGGSWSGICVSEIFGNASNRFLIVTHDTNASQGSENDIGATSFFPLGMKSEYCVICGTIPKRVGKFYGRTSFC
jgi:hypothetical protein